MINTPKDFTARFRVPIVLWGKFKDTCKQNGDKPSEVLRKLIADWVSKNSFLL